MDDVSGRITVYFINAINLFIKQMNIIMSHAKTLKLFNERGELAPDKFIKVIADFELSVSKMRKEQKAFFACKKPAIKQEHLLRSKELENQVDHHLSNMGYDEQQNLF